MDNLGYLPSLFLRSGFACLIGGFGQLLGDDRNRKDLIGEPSRSTLQTRKTTFSDAVFACSSISPLQVTLDWSQAEGRPVSRRLPSEAAAVRRPKQSPSVSHGLDPSHKTPSPLLHPKPGFPSSTCTPLSCHGSPHREPCGGDSALTSVSHNMYLPYSKTSSQMQVYSVTVTIFQLPLCLYSQTVNNNY